MVTTSIMIMKAITATIAMTASMTTMATIAMLLSNCQLTTLSKYITNTYSNRNYEHGKGTCNKCFDAKIICFDYLKNGFTFIACRLQRQFLHCNFHTRILKI